ncbi:methyltransferase domain-containing protein [Periconia macrospinosa]|uniref:phosphoethanolamine N-methyltransferase n=1 Tax=Periconia macrospinosa TaxID=97972 RepID=A0A2V1E3J1_9PLEO|nr:methyltransferase domain-containing protein [Periconia macrospinosa]
MASTQGPEVPANLKARLEATYDAIAVTYNKVFADENDPFRGKYTSQMLHFLQQNAPEKASVLELGCGAGVPGTRMLLESKSPEIHVIGNDFSSGQIDLAHQRLGKYEEAGRLEFKKGDMMSLEFPRESFDAAVGFYSIIHLPRDEQTELVNRVVKWLKPGGLLLANFDQKEFNNKVNSKWLDHEKGWAYWSGWGEEGSAKMVEEAGLNILVKEVSRCETDATFVWIIARKPWMGDR